MSTGNLEAHALHYIIIKCPWADSSDNSICRRLPSPLGAAEKSNGFESYKLFIVKRAEHCVQHIVSAQHPRPPPFSAPQHQAFITLFLQEKKVAKTSMQGPLNDVRVSRTQKLLPLWGSCVTSPPWLHSAIGGPTQAK